MNYAFVILGVVFIFVLYYYLYSDGSAVLSNKLDLNTAQSAVPITSISSPDSRRYSIEMWMYVYNFGGSVTPTYIISREGVENDGTTAVKTKNIGIKLDNTSPKLYVEYSKKITNGSKSESQLITDNFPLQTWVHLIVSVDNSFIDVYMNGKLVKSFQDTINAPSATSLIQYGQVNCYLAKMTRTLSATDPQTAWDHYISGNGENPLAKYLANFGLSVTLQKNNQDYSKITVF
jgi:hypothetical protein